MYGCNLTLQVDDHIGAAVSGLIGGKWWCGLVRWRPVHVIRTYNRLMVSCMLQLSPPDARTLVDHARIEAQNHRFTFDEVSFLRALIHWFCVLLSAAGLRCCWCTAPPTHVPLFSSFWLPTILYTLPDNMVWLVFLIVFVSYCVCLLFLLCSRSVSKLWHNPCVTWH